MTEEDMQALNDLLEALPNVLDRIQLTSCDMGGNDFYTFRNDTRSGRNAAQDVGALLEAWDRVRG
jgi:hypothetical protein